jgi:hypothetical protein
MEPTNTARTTLRDLENPRARAALLHLRTLAKTDRVVAAELPRIEAMSQRGGELATLGVEQDNAMMIDEARTMLEAPAREAPPHVHMAVYLEDWVRSQDTEA